MGNGCKTENLVGYKRETGGTIVELGQKRAHSTLLKLPPQGWSTYISLNQQNENLRAPPYTLPLGHRGRPVSSSVQRHYYEI